MQARREFVHKLGAWSKILLLSMLTCGITVCHANSLVGTSCSGEIPGIKYVNPDNCRTYIMCNTGLYELWYCPSGFYNPALYDCDLDYKCRQDNLPDGTTRVDETTTTTDSMTTLMDNWISTTIFETTSSPTTEETLSESTSTETSTSSKESELTSTSTTEATHVTTTEATTPNCDTTTTSMTTTTTISSSSVSPTTKAPTTLTTEVPSDVSYCPPMDSGTPIFFADKQNCEKYYLCYHSQPVELRCITGMYWNADTKMCDYPQNVKCPADANGDANPLPKCADAGLYSMPHPSRCEYFLMCMDGLQTIQQCDAFHRWDVVAQTCMMKDRATCILDITKPDWNKE